MGSQKKQEVAGDTLASQRLFDQQMVRIGALATRFEKVAEKYLEMEHPIVGIRIATPESGRGDYLCVVTAYSGSDPVVAFHGAETFAEALVGALNRLENGSMKWRPDEYRK